MTKFKDLILGICIAGSGCTDAPSIDQFTAGEQLYATYCAHCHEVEKGIGPRLTPAVLATRVTAQSLFNYNRRNMPYEAGNTLPEDQYWSITAYLLIRHGFVDQTIPLGPENAPEISLTEK